MGGAEQAATVAAMVLARANLMDPRVRKGDAAVTAVWAGAIAPHRLDQRHLLDAVTAYYSEPRERSIGVGDVIRIARDARQREALLENGRGGYELESPGGVEMLPAGSSGGWVNAVGDPVGSAYEVNGALRLPCPRCGARPGEWCESGGRSLKIPCVGRLAAGRHTGPDQTRTRF